MRLRYTLPALTDLTSVLDYIAAHSPQSARRVQSRIKALTDLLLLHPYIGRRTNDPAIRRMTTTLSLPGFLGGRSSFTRSGMRHVIHPECPAPGLLFEPLNTSHPADSLRTSVSGSPGQNDALGL